VAYDQKDSEVFMSDQENNKVSGIGVDANLGTNYLAYTVPGTDDLAGVAVDQSSNCNGGPCLYTTNQSYIYEFNVNNGAAVTTISTYNGVGFSDPWGLAVNSAGTTLVVSDGNAIVQLEPGAGTAQVFSTYNNGTSSVALAPNFCAMDSTGNIYVANTSPAVVVKLSPSGETVEVFGTAGGAAFTLPNGVALDSSNNLYITDNAKNVNIFWKYTP